MSITASVGPDGKNNRADVKTIQILLNLSLPLMPGAVALNTDGDFGRLTKGAVQDFQRFVMNVAQPDGMVNPGSPTLKALQDGMPTGFSADKLAGIAVDTNRKQIDKYAPALQRNMPENAIDTPLRMAHFLAQVIHESDDLNTAEEYASGAAYEGRADLGNTQPGDGKRFKGRGLIQLTGRDNYRRYGAARGKDYLTGDNPKLISSDPELAVDVSCWFWTTKKINNPADLDDVDKVTKLVNGGLTHLDRRKEKLKRA